MLRLKVIADQGSPSALLAIAPDGVEYLIDAETYFSHRTRLERELGQFFSAMQFDCTYWIVGMDGVFPK